MKVTATLLFSSLTLLSVAQVKDYPALQVAKQPIKQGQTITINYTPAKGSLKAADPAITATLFAYTKGQPTAFDLVLAPGKKGVLQSTFIVNDSTDAIAIRFDKGEDADNNGGNGYFYTVLNKDGNPIPAGNLSLYRLYRGDYYAGTENPKPEVAKKYMETWLQHEDRPAVAFTSKLEMALGDKDTAALCELLSTFTQQKDLTEANYRFLQNLATRICKDTKLVGAIKSDMEAKLPNGDWRYQPWADNLNKATTPAEKLVWMKAFQLAHPDDATKEIPYVVGNLAPTVARFAAAKFDVKTFDAAVSELANVKGQQQNLAQMYNSIAWQSVGKDTLLDEVLPLSKKSLDIIEALMKDPSSKPAMLSPAMYAKNMESTYAMFADTYGFILLKMEQYDSAFYYLDIAATQRKMKDAEINKRYFNAMEKAKPATALLAKMDEALLNDGFTPAMHEQYIRTAKAAGVADADKQLNALLAKAKDKKYGEFKTKMINESTPAFSLVNLEGKPVSLESLKGKVVVVDFWATWCGPCIASFPGMQKVVDARKNDPEVEMLFVNSWQQEPNKTQHVKDYLSKQPYTFHVLMDTEDKMIQSFKVNGIPTKFIIDKKGNIRFKSVGYNGSTDKTFDEMQMMIDLAKES